MNNNFIFELEMNHFSSRKSDMYVNPSLKVPQENGNLAIPKLPNQKINYKLWIKYIPSETVTLTIA